MRKNYYIYSLILVGLLMLSGCGEAGNNNQNANTKTATDTQNQTAKVDEVKKDEVKADTSGLAPYFQTTEVEYKTPVEMDKETVLAKYKKDMLAAIDTYNTENHIEASASQWKDIVDFYNFYDVGTIKKAPYEGWKLVNLDLTCEGPCDSANMARFAFDPKTGTLAMLKNITSADVFGGPDFDYLKKTADDKFTLPGFNLPKTVMLPDGINSIELDAQDVDIYVDKIKTEGSEMSGIPENSHYQFVDIGKEAFKDAKLGQFYFAGSLSGCLFVKLPDGTVSKYSYSPRFFDSKHYQSIKWDDKKDDSALTDSYSYLTRGCGIGASCYFIEDVKADELKKVGQSTEGLDLYMTKEPDNITDKDLEDTNSTKYTNSQKAFASAFNTYNDSWEYQDPDTRGKKMTFSQFVSLRPLLYWKDPFGRYVALIENSVKPMAECGKPVIYLYPEKTTDVSVKVGIDKFTKTVPEYGKEGWTVKAEPNGKLLNKADGKTYPYLFWEGTTDKSIGVNRGFVVAKADLDGFLDGSLSKLGLNKQEKADFVEFWLPIMKDNNAPYLFVSFAGATEFNKIAPLDISPKPETLIRVFMYYQPLASQIKVLPQELTAVERKGFTVVEWGGTSSDAWQIK